MTRESHTLSADLSSSTNMSRSLQNLSYNLRNLLRSMAGENPEIDDHSFASPDGHFDNGEGPSSSLINPSDLEALLEALDQHANYADSSGREDWAIEREFEISRLERENEELRKMLGIDPDSIARSGVNMEAEITKMDRGRHPELARQQESRVSHQREDSGDMWYPVNPGQGPYQPQPQHPFPQQQQQMQMQMQMQNQNQNQSQGGAPLQRAMDMSNARMNAPRRPAFSSDARRGNTIGRGAPPSGAGPPQNPWTAPASPAPPIVSDRAWPSQGGGSSLDLGR